MKKMKISTKRQKIKKNETENLELNNITKFKNFLERFNRRPDQTEKRAKQFKKEII